MADPRLIPVVPPLDEAASAAARAHLDRLTKPPGSLGRLEELVTWLAGVTGDPFASVDRRRIVVAAADHGIARVHAVSAWPAEVTAQMVGNFLAGGAAISALAAAAHAELVVLDVGVATSVPAPAGSSGGRAAATLVSRPIAPGTADMTTGPAMTGAQAESALEAGLEAAAAARAAGIELLGIGEMGIGNSTAASALVAALTGRPPADVTGRGTGIDDAGLARKIAAIELALERNRPDPTDPLGVLAAVGGFEIAALSGVILGAAGSGMPLILDGFITGAAALVAAVIEPSVAPRLLASHRSPEPGHAVVLERLGLRPLLDLELRLGEATGAALAMLLVDAAVRVRDGMSTFDAAGVDERRG